MMPGGSAEGGKLSAQVKGGSHCLGTGMKCPVQVEGGSLIGSRVKRLGLVQGGSACAEL